MAVYFAIIDKLIEEGFLMDSRFNSPAETAAADACKMEHIISDETFAALKNHLENHMQ
jgi:Mn-dependent DtxR family transcriptional regulator